MKRKKLFPFGKSFLNKNRQEFKKTLYVNGSIYILNGKNYINDPNLLKKNSTAYIMDKKHSIQIDDYFDVKLIKNLIK